MGDKYNLSIGWEMEGQGGQVILVGGLAGLFGSDWSQLGQREEVCDSEVVV